MIRREFLKAAGVAVAGLTMAAVETAPARAEKSKAKPPPVRIGQIGTAHAHAGGKMDALRRLRDDYEVVGIVEPDPERRKAAERIPVYRGLKWMTEEELLHTPGLKAVAVETAVQDLVPTAARCIEAGMHLHLDKPAGQSLAEFRRVLDAASARRLTVQMGYMFRHNPAFRFCFQAVREGWLGRVFSVHGVMGKRMTADARHPLLQYRGGIMFELGCHVIDALTTVLGKPDAVTPHGRRTRPEMDGLLDNQLAVFDYPQATATIQACAVEVEGEKRRQFTVCGTEGTIDIRPLEPPKLLLALSAPRGAHRKGYQEIALPAMPGRYDDHLIELARIVRGEKETEYPPAHDLLVQELVLRASGMKGG